MGDFTLSGNWRAAETVYRNVTFRALAIVPIVVICSLGAIPGDYASAQQKFALIEAERLRPGARVALSLPELTAYAEHRCRPG